jgi:hypothetical protein
MFFCYTGKRKFGTIFVFGIVIGGVIAVHFFIATNRNK